MSFLTSNRAVEQILPKCDRCGRLFGAGPFTANGTPLDKDWQGEWRTRVESAGWRIVGSIALCGDCAVTPFPCPTCGKDATT